MDSSFLIGLTGIVLTLLGTWLTFKFNIRHELIFVQGKSYMLFKGIVATIDELEVTYEGKKISDNLITYNGALINSGNVDIDHKNVYKPLSIVLPEGFKWKKFVVSNAPKGIRQEVKIDSSGSAIKLEWDILKQKEALSFNSIIEITSSENTFEDEFMKSLIERIKYEHRIKGVGKVKNVEEPGSKKEILQSFILPIFFIVILISMLDDSVEIWVQKSYESRQDFIISLILAYSFLLSVTVYFSYKGMREWRIRRLLKP